MYDFCVCKMLIEKRYGREIKQNIVSNRVNDRS